MYTNIYLNKIKSNYSENIFYDHSEPKITTEAGLVKKNNNRFVCLHKCLLIELASCTYCKKTLVNCSFYTLEVLFMNTTTFESFKNYKRSNFIKKLF